MFSRALQLLTEYTHIRLSQIGEDLGAWRQIQDRMGEAVDGLRQLSFIINRVKELDAQVKGVRTEDTVVVEMKVLTEAFYYKAFRVQKLINMEPYPALISFKCRAVRDIRNHLLEHPEGGASGVTSGGFGFGGIVGPALKYGRSVEVPTVFPDAGLYVNSEEFRSNLEHALEMAIAQLGA